MNFEEEIKKHEQAVRQLREAQRLEELESSPEVQHIRNCIHSGLIEDVIEYIEEFKLLEGGFPDVRPSEALSLAYRLARKELLRLASEGYRYIEGEDI